MPAQSTTLSPQQLIAAAKAPISAYNDKNWGAVKASTHRGRASHSALEVLQAAQVRRRNSPPRARGQAGRTFLRGNA